jgi:hypothetical protein
MAQLNAEYGSELHLLRMLGRHRTFLDRSVCEAMKADAVEWQDFPSGEKHTEAGAESAWDREWQRLDFLPDGDLAKAGWPTVWPAHRQGQSWDAIGRVTIGGAREWLLVEAKANIEELKSSCGAADPVSRDLIERTLADTKRAIGVAPDCDWLSGYYQFCNRLVVLRWLNENGAPARLLYIYFTGDKGDNGDKRRRTCPAAPGDWNDALDARDAYLGMQPGHALEGRMHKVFIDVRARG